MLILVFVLPCLTTFASPLPLPGPTLERRNPFTLYDPNGGDGLFSDDGTTRTIPEGDVPIVIDTYENERVEDHQDMVELVKRYAPVFKLSSKEEWFPSSVDFMLAKFDHAVTWDGESIAVNTSLFNAQDLGHLPKSGQRLTLSIPDTHNPQPTLSGNDSNYLMGTQPTFVTERGEVDEEIYGIWVDRGRGVVDLHYWTYYPFNFGKPTPFGWLGHHVSDWEVRTVNGTATSVDYNTHGGPGSDGTIRWQDVPKIDDRPVAYVAAGSHGVWSFPGRHVYADILSVISLVDETDDTGPIWDTKSTVVPIQWWNGPSNGTLVHHTGSLGWMNFIGRWGNLGDNSWLNKLAHISWIIDGPTGPNRDFRGNINCAVGEASPNQTSSTYSFLLRPEMALYAQLHGVTNIKVEQMCEWSQSDVEGEDENAGETDGGVRDVVITLSKHKTEAIVPFNGLDKHTVSVPGCKSLRNAISSYRLTFCTPQKCLVPSYKRKICTHNNTKGYTPTKAVILDDLDEWTWDVERRTAWEEMRGMINRGFYRTIVILMPAFQWCLFSAVALHMVRIL